MPFSVKYKVKIIVKILAVFVRAWHEGCSCNRSGSENLERKEVSQMKKSLSLLCNLLLSSTLFWGVPSVKAEEMVSSVPTDITDYCHLKFPAMREDSLSWERPVLDSASGNIIDFYGPCDYDPTGLDEVRAQRRVLLRGNFEDGD
jgi:hypothetical protein